MVNINQHLINKIKLEISEEVLRFAFLSNKNTYNTNLESEIFGTVIEPILLTDLSLVSGRQINIPLGQTLIERYEAQTIIYVPDNILNGNTIISVGRILLGTDYATTSTYDGNPIMAAIDGVMSAHFDGGPSVLTNIRIVGKNTLLVNSRLDSSDGLIDCNISYENRVSSITPALQPLFIELAVLMVKSYIYTKRHELEQMSMMHNVDVSHLLDEVNEFSSAAQEYNDKKNEYWQPMAMSADPQQMDEYIGMMIM